MVVAASNATGWVELVGGNMTSAVYTMYNTAFAGFAVVLLFFLYQGMLYMKTRNLPLGFVTGLIFVSLYAFSIEGFIHNAAIQIMFILLAFQLAAILYQTFWK